MDRPPFRDDAHISPDAVLTDTFDSVAMIEILPIAQGEELGLVQGLGSGGFGPGAMVRMTFVFDRTNGVRGS